MLILILVLIALLFFSTVNWIKRYISTLAILYYIETKNYKQPSDKELKLCTEEAVKHLFKN